MSSSVVYLSGPHGAGKTSTIGYLQDHYGYLTGARVGSALPEMSAYERASVRTIKYFTEQRLNRAADPGVNGALIADRCIYDTLAYLDAYFHKQWISRAQHRAINEHIDHLFLEDGLPSHVVFLIPSIEVLQRRLNLRSVHEVRWKQDDIDFLHVLRSAYLRLYDHLVQRCKTLLIDDGDYAHRSALIHAFIKNCGLEYFDSSLGRNK